MCSATSGSEALSRDVVLVSIAVLCFELALLNDGKATRHVHRVSGATADGVTQELAFIVTVDERGRGLHVVDERVNVVGRPIVHRCRWVAVDVKLHVIVAAAAVR